MEMSHVKTPLREAREKVIAAQRKLDEAWIVFRKEQELALEKMLFEGPGLMSNQIAWSNSWTAEYIDWLKAKLELADVEMSMWD